MSRLANAHRLPPSARRSLTARAPTRIDFGGGWTDVPPYSIREGGVVVAAAIQLFAHAEVSTGGNSYRLVSEDIGLGLDLPDIAALSSGSELPLLRAGLRMLPVGHCTIATRSDSPPPNGL